MDPRSWVTIATKLLHTHKHWYTMTFLALGRLQCQEIKLAAKTWFISVFRFSTPCPNRIPTIKIPWLLDIASWTCQIYVLSFQPIIEGSNHAACSHDSIISILLILPYWHYEFLLRCCQFFLAGNRGGTRCNWFLHSGKFSYRPWDFRQLAWQTSVDRSITQGRMDTHWGRRVR